MANDDPWDWDVDRVVQELCTANRSWTPRSASAPTPEFTILEVALRREGISGDILLVDVDDTFLRSDLQMTAKSWRSFILHAVKVLRLRSLQYISYLEDDETPRATKSMEEAIARGIRDGLQGFMEYQAKSAQGSVSGGNLVGFGQETSLSADAVPLKTFTNAEGESSKRLKLDFVDANGDNLALDVGTLQNYDQITGDEDSPRANPELKKRKRIAPTLITSEIDPNRNREIFSAADEPLVHTPEPTPEPQPEPGASFVGKDGKKRMIPILQSAPISALPRSYDDSFKQSGDLDGTEQSRKSRSISKTPARGYLGNKAMPIDKLFYEGVAVGEQVDISDDMREFCYVSQQFPTGQRRYVGNMIKKSLVCEWKSVARGEESFLAVLPYSTHMVPRFQKPSFTLYSSKDGQTLARRENNTDWPELDAAANRKQMIDERTAIFNPLGPDIIRGASYNEWDPSSLEKYKHLEGGEELLPLYGDSDSDNEYDEGTWKEIEKEKNKELDRPLGKSNRPTLTSDVVNEAIDEGIAHFTAKWISKSLPKLEKKAWRLWMKSRKRGSKRVQIIAAQEDLTKINERLEKLRSKILEESYTSKARVHKQTTNMEASVFDREELSWKISTLKKKSAPEKLLPIIPASKRPIAHPEYDDGLEGENLESQSEGSSSENSLNDFIADEEEEEDDIAASEEEQDVTTDSPDEEILISDGMSREGIPSIEDETSQIARKRSISSETLSINGGTPHLKKEHAIAAKPQGSMGGSKYIDLTITSSDETTPIKINKVVIDLDTPPPSKLNLKARVRGSQTSSVPFDNENDHVSRAQGDRLFGDVAGNEGEDAIAMDYDSEDEEPLSTKRRIARNQTSSEDLEDELSVDDFIEDEIPRKKKKFVEDVQAREKRERVQRSRAEQDARRQELHSKLASQGDGDSEDNGRIIINDAAAEGSYYYLNEHLAQRVKKHQINGIRFLWAGTITEKDGCLLAHTMGLGKTMQAIALLVSIAEVSASEDPLLSSQIPERLRESRTLVLCPPGLIANWWDELLTWVRPNDLLGELSKVDASVPLGERLQRISDWHANGGVLILGYEMFRSFITNMKTDKREPILSEEQHKRVSEELLKGPNIVVADEAHKLKNAEAVLTQAALRFDTKCRIALTGSPLSNNITEYHTMIEWISPNWLGPAKEFKAKFAEPIAAGLYSDSTPQERSRSRTMLRVLEKDIDPKVQRADMSVLKHDMPPKTEFTITVALTDLQKQAYSHYVSWSTNGALVSLVKDGKIQNPTLWKYLGILSLICNHPSLFKTKLVEAPKIPKGRTKPAPREIAEAEAEDTIGFDNPEDADDTCNLVDSKELVDKVDELFDPIDDVDCLNLSNKTKVLFQILDAAREANDKTLVFSQSIPTLDFLEKILKRQGRLYARLDGATKMNSRQKMTKDFNDEKNPTNVFIVSTTAGGLGLNLQGANRVVIFDFKFNPIQEEQAIGRAYRIGQQKETFVYRLIAGGTFEPIVYNTTVFKQQLASRVVDKKAQKAVAMRKVSEYIFQPEDVPQKDISELVGMDPQVLDKILESQTKENTIRVITQSDNFEREDEGLTPDEELLVAAIQEAKRKGRQEPDLYDLKALRNPQGNQMIKGVQGAHDGVVLTPQHQLRFGEVGAVKQTESKSAIYLPPPSNIIEVPQTNPSGELTIISSTPAVVKPATEGFLSTPVPSPASSNRHVPSKLEPAQYDNIPARSPLARKSNEPGQLKDLSYRAVSDQGRSNSATASPLPRSPVLPPNLAIISPQSQSSMIDVTGSISKIAESSSQIDNPVIPSRSSAVNGQPSIKSQVSFALKEKTKESSVSRMDDEESEAEETAIEKSNLYKAMNRKPPPVASLRTPVVKKHKRHASSSGNGRHVERDQNRRKSGVASPSPNKPINTLAKPIASPSMPSWARENIELARKKSDQLAVQDSRQGKK